MLIFVKFPGPRRIRRQLAYIFLGLHRALHHCGELDLSAADLEICFHQHVEDKVISSGENHTLQPPRVL